MCVCRNGTIFVVSSGNTHPVKILATDIPFGSNVVHVVSRVLLPGGQHSLIDTTGPSGMGAGGFPAAGGLGR